MISRKMFLFDHNGRLVALLGCCDLFDQLSGIRSMEEPALRNLRRWKSDMVLFAPLGGTTVSFGRCWPSVYSSSSAAAKRSTLGGGWKMRRPALVCWC